ncbi:MAG: sulfite exporter TauE/SafE family protein [Gemmatimonadetes bacterium]|nr:sulfite exporter TauE/SafE family protein [Gemmatimonadota bacterium]
MNLSPIEWAIASLASVLFGIAKTAMAGLGILPVTIFASVMPAKESVGIALVVLIVADLVAVVIYRRHADWPHLFRLFPWTVAGIFVGTFALGQVNDITARRMIGGMVVALVVFRFVRDRRGPQEETPPHPSFAPVMGIIAGFTTMVANAAGPVMALYLLAMRLRKMTFVGTTAWFFLAINLLKVPFVFSLGLISPAMVGHSLRLWPFAIVGALLGRYMITRINQRLFENASLLLAGAAGIRLLLA